MELKKVCSKCSVAKNVSEFRKQSSNEDGLQKYCKACCKERDKIYYTKNKDIVKEQQKAYRQRNEDVDKKRRRDYYQRNREDILTSQRVFQGANREYMRGLMRDWQIRNPERVKANRQKRISQQILATPTWASLDAIELIRENAVSLTRKFGIKFEVDHIVPIQSNIVCGLHCEHNLQIITAEENMKKHNRYWPNMPGALDE